MSGATREVVVRPLAGHDEARIRDLFDATLVLGRPLPFELAAGDRYRELCLGWYLGPGATDAAVAVDAHDDIVGYALVGVDAADHRRHVRARTVDLARAVAARALVGRIDRHSARFYRRRVRDAFALARSDAATAAVHAHLNVVAGGRDGGAALALRDHIDARCGRAGATAWHGEINALAGRRADGLERIGFAVTGRTPNHTLTWLVGRPVERLSVVRHVGV